MRERWELRLALAFGALPVGWAVIMAALILWGAR